MADLFSMKNRVVLLTGASRGLGRDMALTLAAAGAQHGRAGAGQGQRHVASQAARGAGQQHHAVLQ